MWGKPTNQVYTVTNLSNGKRLNVRWTDRGPGTEQRRRGVIVDLSKAAMIALAGQAGLRAGHIKVEVERIKNGN